MFNLIFWKIEDAKHVFKEQRMIIMYWPIIHITGSFHGMRESFQCQRKFHGKQYRFIPYDTQ